MVTLPNGYHCGFNSGFNTNEAVNYASDYWLTQLIKQKFCKCHSDNVRIDPFMFYENLLRHARFDSMYKHNASFQEFERQLTRKNKQKILEIKKSILENKGRYSE